MRFLPAVLLIACTRTPAPVLPAPDLQIHAEQVRVPGVDGGLRAGLVFVRGERMALQPPEARLADKVKTHTADLLTPGFIDAHAHPAGLGRTLSELDLVGASSYAVALSRVKTEVDKGGSGWILGRGWDQNDWADTPPGGWPLAKDLDPVTADRPAALRRVDGHATWANSAALAAAGITRDTPDPAGGHIVRDTSGQPTGVLVDTAADLLDIPEPDLDQVQAWLRAAQREMHAHGLVGVHDMGVDDTTLAGWRALEASGELKLRVFVYLSPASQAAEALLRSGPELGPRLSIVGIKAYADGALGSRGAHLSAPYADDPSTSGLVIMDRAALTDLAKRCLRVRAQLAVHAIGDQAVTDTLDAFEAAREAVPDAAEVPLRIEHAQVVRTQDRPRFAALNVVASMQPTHATSDMPWAGDRLGPERVSWAYTWRSLAEAGALVPLGSDFPVESVDPALGLHAALHRTDLEGQPDGGWQPEQALSLVEAIDGFTVHTYGALGRPVPGLHTPGAADLSLWERHPTAPEWRASAVFIDGEQVWP